MHLRRIFERSINVKEDEGEKIIYTYAYTRMVRFLWSSFGWLIYLGGWIFGAQDAMRCDEMN
jgi:hypothetical protein